MKSSRTTVYFKSICVNLIFSTSTVHTTSWWNHWLEFAKTLHPSEAVMYFDVSKCDQKMLPCCRLHECTILLSQIDLSQKQNDLWFYALMIPILPPSIKTDKTGLGIQAERALQSRRVWISPLNAHYEAGAWVSRRCDRDPWIRRQISDTCLKASDPCLKARF